MINELLLPKAYTEVLEILKYIPKEEYDKLPNKILSNMEYERDKNYTYIIDSLDDFSKQRMLKETEVILALFFRDYWATEKQRSKIIEKEKHDLYIIEKEKQEKYNPNNIFKPKLQSNLDTKENHLEVASKKVFILKILEKIKKIFKR